MSFFYLSFSFSSLDENRLDKNEVCCKDKRSLPVEAANEFIANENVLTQFGIVGSSSGTTIYFCYVGVCFFMVQMKALGAQDIFQGLRFLVVTESKVRIT